MNFQQIACFFNFPRALLARNGIGRYHFHISACDKLAERIWRSLVVNRELADLATEDEQLLSQLVFVCSTLPVS